MNRQQKEQVIDQLKGNFAKSNASFLVSYKGLTVAQVQELRRKLRAQGGSFKVTKARLMRRAAEGIEGVQNLSPYFKEQIAVIFANKESAPIAKTLVDFAKDHASLVVVAGCLEQSLMDANQIKTIASLPPREVLYAQLCGVLMAPMASLARTVNMIKEKKEQQA